MRLLPFARARAFPAPAPLPALRDALSRRAALFGAVALSGVLAGSAARALSDLSSPADSRLHMLADLMARAERVGKSVEVALGNDCHDAPEWHGAIDCFYDAATLMRDTAAASHNGVRAKARALSLHWMMTDPETSGDIGVSMARDVLRLAGEVA